MPVRSLIIILLFFSGCQTFYDLSENLANNFSAPKRVKSKIQDPLNDSVKFSALWVGQSTILLQIYDKVILTDPFLTNNIALIQKRVVEPGINIKDLRQCDLILISHPHLDHLSLGSLEILEERFPKSNLVFPEGLEDFLPGFSFNFYRMKKPSGAKNVYTGEIRKISGVTITTVRAFHWGGRYGLDGLIWGSNSYCGFIIQYKDVTVYFAGDTGYNEKFFKWLGENYTIDLVLVPIGPCKDCEKIHKKNRHVYPKGALKILDDTKAKLMIPYHFGTIIELSEPDEPKIVLQEFISNSTQYGEKVKILKIGEQIKIY